MTNHILGFSLPCVLTSITCAERHSSLFAQGADDSVEDFASGDNLSTEASAC